MGGQDCPPADNSQAREQEEGLQMKHFVVYGEYGPVANDVISRNVYAQNEQNARVLFESFVTRNSPYLWNRIGQRNVWVEEQ